jgi:SAM-dependent methyltransferase
MPLQQKEGHFFIKIMESNWQNNIGEELDFWRAWLKTNGLDYPEDYKFKRDPQSEVQALIGAYIKTGDELILDVGAGPLTIIGKMWNGKRLKISACDALADQYNDLLKIHGIDPVVRTERCEMELLEEYYPHASFDIVFAQNSVDHSYDPLRAIIQMISICNYGGHVILRHEVNEGQNEGYKGLHQWNFFMDNGCFIIGTRDGQRVNVNNAVAGYNVTIDTTIEHGYIINVIHKL